MGSCLKNDMALGSRGFAGFSDKLKPLTLYYHSAYGHQIWQGGNLLWVAPTHKATWPFNHVVVRDQTKTYLHYQSVYGQQTWLYGNLP